MSNKAVIVRFAGKGFSFKSKELGCMWCKRRFWKSESEIRQTFHHLTFHNEVLVASPSINKQIEDIWKTNS